MNKKETPKAKATAKTSEETEPKTGATENGESSVSQQGEQSGKTDLEKADADLDNGPTYLKKISTALIRGEKKRDAVIGRSAVVAGTLRSYKAKTTDFGECTEFHGQFGIIADNGDGDKLNARSKKLFVPEVVEGYFIDALSGADVSAPDFAGIGFSVKIEAVANEKSSTGYDWSFTPLLRAKVAESEVDRMLAAANSE